MPIIPEGNNAQHQPITTLLYNIIREYPAGGGVLRELCQNADDAGATEVVFVLDETTYTQEPLLHEDLKIYQGPALLAYNDKQFSKQDFKSLSNIGDSEKAKDLNATGKFGRGFNSVYNWTDSPCIISGDSFLLLDPHETWSRKVGQAGGPVYNFVNYSEEPEMQNQLEAFKSIVDRIDVPFEGTVIRIPLRTSENAETSKIVPGKATNAKEIREVFNIYIDEMVETLLFLRNVRKITLRIGDQIYARVESKSTSFPEGTLKNCPGEIIQPYRDILIDGTRNSWDSSFKTEILLTRNGAPEKSFEFAVSHYMTHELGDSTIRKWAREFKMFPWAAVAAPLNLKPTKNVAERQRCRLFSTLPLPIYTRHPFHIHGMFSTTPDRVNIHVGSDLSVSESAETSMGSKWNEILFNECVVPAWLKNLELLRLLNERTEYLYGGWNHWPAGIQGPGNSKEHGSGMLKRLITQIIREDHKLLPTIGNGFECKSHCLYTQDADTALCSNLEDVGIRVITPPVESKYEFISDSDLCAGLSQLSPSLVRNHLNKLDSGLGRLNDQGRGVILHYILSDKNYEDLTNFTARVLPLKNGVYGGFNSSHSRLMLALNNQETTLFTQHKDVIEQSKLPPQVCEQLRSDIDMLQSYTSLSRWNLSCAADYCRNLFSNYHSQEDMISVPKFDKIVDLIKFWEWARTNHTTENIIREFADLWLIPLINNSYRKVGQKMSLPRTLDISGKGDMAEFLNILISTSTELSSRFPFFKGPIQLQQFFINSNLIVDCERPIGLLEWLVNAIKFDFFKFLTDAQRQMLTAKIWSLLESNNAEFRTNKQAVVKLCRQLPLFYEAYVSKSWISISGSTQYVGIDPRIITVSVSRSDTVFIDVGNKEQLALVNGLELAPVATLGHILEHYVIPDIRNKRGSEERIRRLSRFALKHFRELSKDGKDVLAGTNFVHIIHNIFKSPMKVVDPTSEVSKLYFHDENRFPTEDFLTEFREGLKKLGMISEINKDMLIDRMSVFSQRVDLDGDLQEKIQYIFRRVLEPSNLLPRSCLDVRWILARRTLEDDTLVLCNASECRDESYKNLLGYALSIATSEIPASWRRFLEWNRTPGKPIILKQLAGIIGKEKKFALRALLEQGYLDDMLEDIQDMRWVPGRSGTWFRSSDVFIKYANFTPYIDIADEEILKLITTKFRTTVIDEAPSFQKIEELQFTLVKKNSPLDDMDQRVFTSLINRATSRFPTEDYSSFKAPDRHGYIRDLSDLTVGYSSDPNSNHLNFIHENITLWSTERLRIPTVQDRFLESLSPLDEFDFAQDENRISMIKDALKRYPIDTSFNEFLANAEDCGGASKIAWIVDDLDRDSKYPKEKLLSERLKDAQGSAVFSYNDGVFSEADFEAIIEIGVGSKRHDSTKLGRFGRGALTMYHWTPVPSFISGEWFVIFDPEKTRLPPLPATRLPRAGMKLRISDVRRTWPDQLRPFEGLFGFDKRTENFEGTLFRFPSMSWKQDAVSGLDVCSIESSKKYLYKYYREAQIAMLFLQNINSIQCSTREKGQIIDTWKVSVARELNSKSQEDLSVTATLFPYPAVARGLVDKRGMRINTSTGHKTTATSNNESSKWIVKRSCDHEHSIPDALQDIQKRERLEVRYGVAVPLLYTKPSTEGVPAGRVYMDLPLRNVVSKLPIFITADMVMQSNRQGIITGETEKDIGAEWNRWILGADKVVSLYISLLEDIAPLHGTDVYRFWPPPLDRCDDPISKIVSEDFWTKVADSTRRLFPTVPQVNDKSHDGTHCIKLKGALFDFLDRKRSLIMDTLLCNLGYHNIVKVSTEFPAYSGLKAMDHSKIEKISPQKIREVFSSRENSQQLIKIWEELLLKEMGLPEMMNTLLEFALSDDPDPDELEGCHLLLLENLEIGTISKEENFPRYLVSKAGDKKTTMVPDLLNLRPDLEVHRLIDPKLVTKLTGGGFNVDLFAWVHITKSFLNYQPEETVEWRSAWRLTLHNMWKGFNNTHGADRRQDIDPLLKQLKDVPVYVSTKTSNTVGDWKFIKMDEFDSHPAMVDIHTEVPRSIGFKTLRSCFPGILLIEKETVPTWLLEDSNEKTFAGLYRLLKGLLILATRNKKTLSEYILDAVKAHPVVSKNMEKLIGLFTWAKWENVNDFKNLMRQVPMWKTGADESWMSADSILQFPDSVVNWGTYSKSKNFLLISWQAKFGKNLEFLDVRRIDFHPFLSQFRRTENLTENEMDHYISFLTQLISRHNHNALKAFDIAVDGERNFRRPDSLFDHNNSLYQAAFRHETKSRFVHPKLRYLPGLIVPQDVSNETIRLCVEAINNRANFYKSVS
ncbi:hypothetical protein EDC01DRAFT_368311 [Geopyxis carbonaria]|nr:hypothetical protein EDC01DRAFT_368311 [Geopyxis carbonaria]